MLAMGAVRVVNRCDPAALEKQFDLVINTVSGSLDWMPHFQPLDRGGHFHAVGTVMKLFKVPASMLIGGDRTLSGSATGSPGELRTLIRFAARARVAPTTERYPMSRINEALQHMRDDKARYRVMLKADF